MPPTIEATLSRDAVNTIKFLAVDAVEKAKSGHPGLPMGAADVAWVLWSRFLRYDPQNPQWPDRDRFVLSAGHGCMLLYALLHLAGFDLPLSELQSFRQWDSKTPGHPEFGHTVGVEATTGPLGQGVGNAVGMALAAKMLAARFNAPGRDIITQRIFALASDGDLMEGISGEASSLAGHLALGNLILLYDDNHISIEGNTSLAFSEDVPGRYAAYGWHVQRIDGHDHAQIEKAIAAAIGETMRPSLIACRTHIAHGAPNKQDSEHAHGSPLGADEVRATKAAAGWPLEPTFRIPPNVQEFWRTRAQAGAAERGVWQKRFDAWRASDTDGAEAWDAIVGRRVPADITARLLAGAPTTAAATREHGNAVLQQAAALVGGSADLAPSTLTLIKSAGSVNTGEFGGRNLHFGIREHAMGAMLNGILYQGAFRPYGSTFLVFSDYMRPSVRIAALSHLPAIYVFTHDSIFVGEDGPTHEPIEHVASLRLIPNLRVFRPADGYETALAWGMALERQDGPTAIVLTRQKLPPVPREAQGPLADPRRGGYVVAGEGRPDVVIAATGSEVQLAVAARTALAAQRKTVRVVSIPCLEILHAQPQDYRDALLPDGVPTATIEAGRTDPWRALTGRRGLAIGIDRYGASAPGNVLGEKFGFTAESVVQKIKDWLG